MAHAASPRYWHFIGPLLLAILSACDGPITEPSNDLPYAAQDESFEDEVDPDDPGGGTTTPSTTTIDGQGYATYESLGDVPDEYDFASADYTSEHAIFSSSTSEFFYHAKLHFEGTEATNTGSIFFDPGGSADAGTESFWDEIPADADLMLDGYLLLSSDCGRTATASFDGEAATRIYLFGYGIYTFDEASDETTVTAAQEPCGDDDDGGGGDGEEPDYTTYCMVETTYYSDGTSETEVLYCWTEREA